MIEMWLLPLQSFESLGKLSGKKILLMQCKYHVRAYPGCSVAVVCGYMGVRQQGERGVSRERFFQRKI